MKNKGFTLIELIIAIGIGIMVLFTAYNILFVGMKGHSKTLKSFENQADIRYAIETTNQAIRFSTVGFTITDDDFKPTIEGGEIKGLVKPWNYIGLSPDKKSIVHYKYEEKDGKSGNYKMDVLAEGLESLSYDLKFTKPKTTQEDKLIKYILKVKNDGHENVISTEVEAINALHIIDWGDAKKPAIALAYRTEETPEIYKKAVAAMSMVLDTSGSMKWNMDGGNPTSSKPSRISLLQNTLNENDKGLFSILDKSDVFISLIPFSNNANITKNNYNNVTDEEAIKFHNVKVEDDKNKLKNMVNTLTADGGTNTGDGMRRGYHQLIKLNDEKRDKYSLNVNQEIKNYMIVLVDGVTTFGSRNVKVQYNWFPLYTVYTAKEFITDDKDILDGYLMGEGTYKRVGPINEGDNRKAIGNGAELDENHGEAYVKKIGEEIQNTKLNYKPLIDQAFVIGYSNKDSELQSLTNIATSLGIEVNSNEANEKFENNDFVFVATDKDSLEKAFENIGGYINEELWQIEGPRLNP